MSAGIAASALRRIVRVRPAKQARRTGTGRSGSGRARRGRSRTRGSPGARPVASRGSPPAMPRGPPSFGVMVEMVIGADRPDEAYVRAPVDHARDQRGGLCPGDRRSRGRGGGSVRKDAPRMRSGRQPLGMSTNTAMADFVAPVRRYVGEPSGLPESGRRARRSRARGSPEGRSGQGDVGVLASAAGRPSIRARPGARRAARRSR